MAPTKVMPSEASTKEPTPAQKNRGTAKRVEQTGAESTQAAWCVLFDPGGRTGRALLDVVARELQHRLRRHRDRPDRVAGEALVDEHAEDAHHRRAAVVALRVELPLLAALARLVLVADLRC